MTETTKPKKLKVLDREAAERIMSATKPESYAASGPQKLLVGIELCRLWYLEALNPDFPLVELRGMRKAARQIVLSMNLVEDRVKWVSRHRSEAEKLLATIERDVRAREHASSQARTNNLALRSPFEWLAGNYLADLYYILFQKKPSYSIDGPFVRFVEAVLSELNISNRGQAYSRASIAKARKDDEAERPRRKVLNSRLKELRQWRRQLLLQRCMPELFQGPHSDGKFEAMTFEEYIDLLVQNEVK